MIDINTTPLIDVMLVLLVMLIITIPIQLHSVNLNMPVGNPPPPLVPARSRQDRRRSVEHGLLERRGAADRGTRWRTGSRPPPRSSRSPSSTCVPTSTPATRSSPAVMASSQRLGLTKIGIVGSEQFIEE